MLLARLLAAGGSTSFEADDVTSLGWVNVKSYGAVLDGSHDDTDNVADAIAAVNAAGRGVLFLPPGPALITAGLPAIEVPCLVLGSGGGGGETLAYQGGGLTVGHISQVVFDSATGVLFTVASSGVQFRDLSLRNAALTDPSAGAAIQTVAGGGDHAVYADLTIVGFYNQIDQQYGREYSIGPHNHFIDPVNDSLRLQNLDAADEGEVTIFDCRFLQQSHLSNAAVELLRSGGLRVHHNQFYGLGGDTCHNVFVRINLADPTSNVRVSGNSFENFKTHGISVNLSSSDELYTLQIHDNNFDGGQVANHTAMELKHVTNLQVHDNHIIGRGQSFPAIGLTSVTTANIHDNGHKDFSAFDSESSCTGITKAGNYTIA